MWNNTCSPAPAMAKRSVLCAHVPPAAIHGSPIQSFPLVAAQTCVLLPVRVPAGTGGAQLAGTRSPVSAVCLRAVMLMCCVCSASQSPGSLYLSFYVIFAQTTKEMDGGSAALFIFSLTYIFSFFIVVLAAVGNDIAAVYVLVLCWGKCFPYQWRSML